MDSIDNFPNLVVETILKLCRVCESSTISVDMMLDHDHKFALKFQNITGVMITGTGGLPTTLCEVCANQLAISFDFKKKCEEAEVKWRKILLNDVMSLSEPVLNVEQVKEEQYTDIENEEHIISNDKVEKRVILPRKSICNKKSSDTKHELCAKFECETCSTPFTAKDDYNEHIKIHGRKRFKCAQCSKWFQYKYLLNCHQKERCGENVIKYNCEFCLQCYSNRNNLKRHIAERHEGLKPFECETCGKCFSQKTVLASHRLVHIDTYEFCCDDCPKKFKLEKQLYEHKQIHLPMEQRDPAFAAKPPRNQVKICVCSYCGKISKSLASHYNHIRTHTNETPFACKSCPKQFRCKTGLISHELIHSDQKPYKCKICGACFRQIAHLKTHNLLRHIKLKNFTCVICSKPFALKGLLTQHMKTHKDRRTSVDIHGNDDT
ncbi:gastrula zinc finger protein XlCGF52.1-like [Wyeomyia smithii]|uniref:gastrula zinc finger protein XlCGF52.1-like n=1 Tax=Wyeomyia smithii TaxID=174621 RepID=UPI002467FCE8|nr:gastrula zinc finger protein XlCGF52.1-like [Wyeomyia smithii]